MKSYLLLALNGFLTISAGNSNIQENNKNPNRQIQAGPPPVTVSVTSGVPPEVIKLQTPTPVATSAVSKSTKTSKTVAESVPGQVTISTIPASVSRVSESQSVGKEEKKSVESPKKLVEKNDEDILSTGPIPEFRPEVPANLLHLEKIEPIRNIPKLNDASIRFTANNRGLKIFDGTEYTESKEHLGLPSETRSKHFLRHPEGHSIGKERRTIDVDETPVNLIESSSSEFDDYMSHFGDQFDRLAIWVTDGVKAGYDGIVKAYEHFEKSIFSPAMIEADTWAQETRAGFMGYFDSLSSVVDKESESVGKKLFEVADAYSHRFINLVHVKESHHPALVAKMARIILTIGLSLTLVFIVLIFQNIKISFHVMVGIL
jgi:hypothetical protein